MCWVAARRRVAESADASGGFGFGGAWALAAHEIGLGIHRHHLVAARWITVALQRFAIFHRAGHRLAAKAAPQQEVVFLFHGVRSEIGGKSVRRRDGWSPVVVRGNRT